jgi:hypothetical protein
LDAYYFSLHKLTVSDPVPTLDDIDHQLALWETRVARVKANLDLLQETPTYAFISGGLKLSGRTQQEIAAPIMAAHELADQYDLLAGQVARARLLRDSLRRFLPSNKLLPPNRDTLREIERLLNEPCIPLPAAQVTLAERTLLDDPTAKSQLSLAQMLEIMAPAFAAARDAVARFDAVMAELTPVSQSLDAQLQALTARASVLGASAEVQLESVKALVADARRQALDDPLGVESALEVSVREPLRRLDEQLTAIEHDRASMRDELVRARGRQARAERSRVLDPTQIAELGDWLASIGRTLDKGEFKSARVGLQRWTISADSMYGGEEQRREQLDLLRALRAMAQRRREQGVVIDAELDAVALEAEAVLRNRPVNLTRASQLVEQYQRGVTAPSL